jgi:hypothetical protein
MYLTQSAGVGHQEFAGGSRPIDEGTAMPKDGDEFSWCVVALLANATERALVDRALERLRRRGVVVHLLPQIAKGLTDEYDRKGDAIFKVH